MDSPEPSTDREFALSDCITRRQKLPIHSPQKRFTTKYTVPEHPKSNDFISDFTVAADSDGVGDALLMQTPCQRLLVSASIDSTSSAVSLQSRKQIKVSGNRKCKQRLKVFICSKANPTMHIVNCNAQNVYPLLPCSCSCFGVPSRC